MAKQPIKKKDVNKIMSFDINTIKETMKFNETSTVDKPIEWIIMPQPFQDALKLPGFPKGYMSAITGWSDTGKSTIKNSLIAACMKQNILPIVFETEGNFDAQYAIDCGVEIIPVYGDVETTDFETGEVSVKKGVVDYDGSILLYTNNKICDFCGDNDYASGTKKKAKRKIAVIEDVFYIMNTFLDMQSNGELPRELCFIWDSIGSIGSYKSFMSKSGNSMFDAKAYAEQIPMINTKLTSSRDIDSQFTNTFFAVNKIWNDSMNSMGGLPSLKLKGGETLMYNMRLIIHVGGMSKSSTKKLKATYKGEDYKYGIISKIKVTKNHLPTPFNISYEGEVACVHCGLWDINDIDAYKKMHIPTLMSKLIGKGDVKVDNNSDIEFSETDEQD